MKRTTTTRTWDSVCGDCTRLTGGVCAARHPTTGETDCIAAICVDFTPGGCAQKENGDA